LQTAKYVAHCLGLLPIRKVHVLTVGQKFKFIWNSKEDKTLLTLGENVPVKGRFCDTGAVNVQMQDVLLL
jgi:hypothetical protein